MYSVVCLGQRRLPVGADCVILREMGALSNILVGSDGREWSAGVEYRLARPDEFEDGIALVLSNHMGPAAAEQVAEFMQFASLRGIELQNLWLAGVGGRMSWALLPVTSPGRTMLLLSPPLLPAGLDAGPLIEACCRWFCERGGLFAQVLLDPPDGMLRGFFEQHSFRHIAELEYLQANVRRTAPPAQLPPGFHWRTYSPDSHHLFARVISQSYLGSLDCPALNGLREIEDIIAGHRASGECDERFWFVLLERDEPLGVLLLTRVPRHEMAELVYLGLSPQARRRGIGDLMMRQAFWAVTQMGLGRITLAVDSLNEPALKLYYRHGLQHAGRKSAMLRELSGPASSG
jgi:mycothiol synthase